MYFSKLQVTQCAAKVRTSEQAWEKFQCRECLLQLYLLGKTWPNRCLMMEWVSRGQRLPGQCPYANPSPSLWAWPLNNLFSSLFFLPMKLTLQAMFSKVSRNHRHFKVRQSLGIIQFTSHLLQVQGLVTRAPDLPPPRHCSCHPSQGAHSTRVFTVGLGSSVLHARSSVLNGPWFLEWNLISLHPTLLICKNIDTNVHSQILVFMINAKLFICFTHCT